MIRAHKIEIDPTEPQKVFFTKACGTSRFVWNWALGEWTRQYQSGGKPNGLSLSREFNSKYRAEFPWMQEMSNCIRTRSFITLQSAMNLFFKGGRYPKFKKRGRAKDSFYVANNTFYMVVGGVFLPRIGRVRLRESLRLQGKILGATVSRSADRWFISIHVAGEHPRLNRTGLAKLGIDLGVKTSVTCSDGETYQSPKPLKKFSTRLARLQQRLSKKKKGSANRKKAILKVAKLHYRIACIKNDFLHKTTTAIVRKSQAVCIEDLSVKNMVKNRKLAKAISEQNFYEFQRQIEYKAKAYGVTVIVVDRFFPSSKTCSCCGSVKKELGLGERTYSCAVCGLGMDRDLNAAKNLEKQIPGATRESKPVDRCKTP